MLTTVRQKPWQKTQLWGLYKTQDGSQLPATLTFTFLERMAPLLKPDGVMVFDVFSAPTLAKLKEHSEAGWATYYHPSWLIDHLAVFGLEVQRRLSQPYGIAGSSEYWFVKRQTSPAPV